MQLFWEFFRFELKFRFKSISTYVYFGIWFFFSFLCIASESFGPIAAGNGKVLLNGPFANVYNDIFASLFGLIVIGAILGLQSSVIFNETPRRSFSRSRSQNLHILGEGGQAPLSPLRLPSPDSSSESLPACSRHLPTKAGWRQPIYGGISSHFSQSFSFRYFSPVPCSSRWQH